MKICHPLWSDMGLRIQIEYLYCIYSSDLIVWRLYSIITVDHCSNFVNIADIKFNENLSIFQGLSF